MNTECKDCKFRKGDCGYHFLFNGVVNYDIPSLSACDKYGDCMFFKSTAESKGDLISREALKKAMRKAKRGHYAAFSDVTLQGIYRVIDNAPTVEISGLPKIHYDRGFIAGYEKGKAERPTGEWINHRNDYGHNIADCLLCGKATQWHDEDEDGIPRYCWYCGAKMYGGRQ